MTNWEGYTKKEVQPGVYKKWNKATKNYEIVGAGDKKGIQYTFFAARGFYPKKGIAAENVFTTQAELGMTVWRENETRNGKHFELARHYHGRVPLQELMDLIDEKLNILDNNGKVLNFRKAYTQYEWKYSTGIAIKIDGKLYQFLDSPPKGGRKGM